MIQNVSGALEKFQNSVGIKFQLYNSLFFSLPFYGIDKTGILLSLFNTELRRRLSNGKKPGRKSSKNFSQHNSIAAKKKNLICFFASCNTPNGRSFLFDALEDAAFRELNDMQGAGTLKQLETRGRAGK